MSSASSSDAGIDLSNIVSLAVTIDENFSIVYHLGGLLYIPFTGITTLFDYLCEHLYNPNVNINNSVTGDEEVTLNPGDILNLGRESAYLYYENLVVDFSTEEGMLHAENYLRSSLENREYMQIVVRRYNHLIINHEPDRRLLIFSQFLSRLEDRYGIGSDIWCDAIFFSKYIEYNNSLL
jgi:hypothetical protein